MHQAAPVGFRAPFSSPPPPPPSQHSGSFTDARIQQHMSRGVRAGLGWASGHLPCRGHASQPLTWSSYQSVPVRSILADSLEVSPPGTVVAS